MKTVVVAAIGLIATFLTAVGCDSSPSDQMAEPPPAPCASVYSAAFNACVAAHPCSGFGCLDVWQGCSLQAKTGPLTQCCYAHYGTEDERQLCYDSLGQEP